jgi:peptide/nickel transport system permease protein
MLGYALKRLLLLIPVLAAITLIVFVTLSLIPGSSALAILGPYATPERVAKIEHELGLDQPAPVRYSRWVAGILRGDFGSSYSMDRPVGDLVFERLGPTLLLGAAALAIGCVLGVLAGSIAARRHGRVQDLGLRALALTGISIPAFLLAMLLVLGLSVGGGWFPASGMLSPPDVEGAGGVVDRLRHLALPAFSLGVVSAGIIARMTRAHLLESIDQDFVRTARAKGLPLAHAIYVHGLRVALVRVMPVIGLQAGFVLGGAVYVETVFQWPGLGRLLVEAIAQRDLILVQGTVLVLATAYVLVNLLTDLAQRALDPRVEA